MNFKSCSTCVARVGISFCTVFILPGGAELPTKVLHACFSTKFYILNLYAFWKTEDFTNTVKRVDPVFLAEIMLG